MHEKRVVRAYRTECVWMVMGVSWAGVNLVRGLLARRTAEP